MRYFNIVLSVMAIGISLCSMGVCAYTDLLHDTTDCIYIASYNFKHSEYKTERDKELHKMTANATRDALTFRQDLENTPELEVVLTWFKWHNRITRAKEQLESVQSELKNRPRLD